MQRLTTTLALITDPESPPSRAPAPHLQGLESCPNVRALHLDELPSHVRAVPQCCRSVRRQPGILPGHRSPPPQLGGVGPTQQPVLPLLQDLCSIIHEYMFASNVIVRRSDTCRSRVEWDVQALQIDVEIRAQLLPDKQLVNA